MWDEATTQQRDRGTQERALARSSTREMAHRTQEALRNPANTKDHTTNIVAQYTNPVNYLA